MKRLFRHELVGIRCARAARAGGVLAIFAALALIAALPEAGPGFSLLGPAEAVAGPRGASVDAKTQEAYERIRKEVGPAYARLAYEEPGIVSRLEHFLEFGKAAAKQGLARSSVALRDAYSAFLGKGTWYRGLVLTDDELKSVLSQGMKLSSGLSGAEGKREVVRNGIEEEVDRRVGRSMQDFATDELRQTLGRKPTSDEVFGLVDRDHDRIAAKRQEFMSRPKHLDSVTGDPEAALWVASARLGNKPGAKVYVFAIHVDILDTVWGNDFESWMAAPVAAADLRVHGAWDRAPLSLTYQDFIDSMRAPRFQGEGLPSVTAEAVEQAIRVRAAGSRGRAVRSRALAKGKPLPPRRWNCLSAVEGLLRRL